MRDSDVNRFRARDIVDEQWLAEAAEALADAERLVWSLAGASPDEAAELDEWRLRIALLRCDVARIRAAAINPRPAEDHSKWMNVSAWG